MAHFLLVLALHYGHHKGHQNYRPIQARPAATFTCRTNGVDENGQPIPSGTRCL